MNARDDAIEHDDYCPDKGDRRCDCEWEARVRADEREKFCDCPAAFTRYKATHEAEVRDRLRAQVGNLDTFSVDESDDPDAPNLTTMVRESDVLALLGGESDE